MIIWLAAESQISSWPCLPAATMEVHLRIGCVKVELTRPQKNREIPVKRVVWWEWASLLENNWLIV